MQVGSRRAFLLQAERRRSTSEETLLELDLLEIHLTRQQVLDMDLNALDLMWKVRTIMA